MKRITRILSVIILSAAVAACNSSSDTLTPDYIAVKVDKGDGWGFLAPNGEVIMADEFKERPSAVVNGLFSVKEGDYYTLYSIDGKHRAQAVCEDLVAAGFLAEGDLIPVVRQRERISVVDRNGDTRFYLEPCKGVEIAYAQNAYYDGRLLVCGSDGKYGYADTSGEYVITPAYDMAAGFNEGYAVVYSSRDGSGRYYIIDRNGDRALTLKKDYEPAAYSVKYGRIAVKDENDRVILVSVPDGEEQRMPARVSQVIDYNDRYCIYSTEDGDCGVVSMDGHESVMRPRFSYIDFRGKGFLAGNSKGSALYDGEGEQEISLGDYKWVHGEGKFGLFALDGNYYVVLDDDGKVRRGAEYDDYNTMWYAGKERLESDYFDVQAVVNAVVDMINAEGLARYRLGAQASQYMSGDAEDYTGTRRETLGDLAAEGYKFDIGVVSYYTENIGKWNYANSDPYDYSKVYRWNPESRLNEFNVHIDTEYPRWGTEGNEALVAGLKTKGFVELAATHKGSDRFMCLLRKGTLYAYVYGDADSTGCNVNFAKATPDEESSIVQKINGVNSGE